MSQANTGGPRLLPEKDAADYVGMSVAFLRKRRRLGLAPSFVKFGKAVRYETPELESFIRLNRVRRAACA
jgi:hypothetical protein